MFQKCRQYTSAKKVMATGCYPYFHPISSIVDGEVTVRGRRLLLMGSNSYLGLHYDPRVKEAAVSALRKYGPACAGSRILNGSLDLHEQLEQTVAELVGKESCLIFATGYHANVGIISSLVGRNEYVVVDKLDHASIIDGCRLSLGTMLRYDHNDLDNLGRTLDRIVPAKSLVVVDGVFSMQGDIVDLPGVVEQAKRHGAAVMVDEAHAVGVLHESGAGTARHFGLTEHVDLIMGTFTKALASVGGFVAADADVIHYLRHHARPLLFSSALPAANTAAALTALEIMRTEPERIQTLWQNRRYMADELVRMGYSIGSSATPILPLHFGEMDKVMPAWKCLHERGIFVNVALPPAVPPHGCLIRCTVMATHTKAQLARALEEFEKAGKETGVLG